MREIRRRTRVIETLPDGNSMLMLVSCGIYRYRALNARVYIIYQRANDISKVLPSNEAPETNAKKSAKDCWLIQMPHV